MVYVYVFMYIDLDDLTYDFLDLFQVVLKDYEESIWIFCIYNRKYGIRYVYFNTQAIFHFMDGTVYN